MNGWAIFNRPLCGLNARRALPARCIGKTLPDSGKRRTPFDALPVLFALPIKRARVFAKRLIHEAVFCFQFTGCLPSEMSSSPRVRLNWEAQAA
jgi:hypothetical protein